MYISVELDEREAVLLESMAEDLDMPNHAVLRAALRLYQQQHLALKLGYRCVTLDKDGSIMEDKVYGCPALD